MMSTTVREFIDDTYSLISANSPTQALHGNDLSRAIRVLNQLLNSYASTGLMLTIARQTSLAITTGQGTIVTGDANYTPTPDITLGRLANLNEAWLENDDVTYPLTQILNSQFNNTFRYQPLQGLPRYIILQPQTEVTNVILYPAPSQAYTLNIRGKFQLDNLTSNDDMTAVPQYYYRFLQFALARDLAKYKGRNQAWTDDLEQTYQEAKLNMEAVSEVNLDIDDNYGAQLNGANAVRAGGAV